VTTHFSDWVAGAAILCGVVWFVESCVGGGDR
jgi:hypothetical protein